MAGRDGDTSGNELVFLNDICVTAPIQPVAPLGESVRGLWCFEDKVSWVSRSEGWPRTFDPCASTFRVLELEVCTSKTGWYGAGIRTQGFKNAIPICYQDTSLAPLMVWGGIHFGGFVWAPQSFRWLSRRVEGERLWWGGQGLLSLVWDTSLPGELWHKRRSGVGVGRERGSGGFISRLDYFFSQSIRIQI